MLSIDCRCLESRPVVFLLALASFACLLGQFYGLWSMRPSSAAPCCRKRLAPLVAQTA